MPLLCPFLSKTSPTAGDTSMPSFHGPIDLAAWNDTTSEQYAAIGHLTQQNPSTKWDIDLHVPCFTGQCGQDWATYVHTANPTADPNAYLIDPNLKGQLLGCDLWYEVTGVNRTPPVVQPKVGADFTTYVAPTACDVTVPTPASDITTIAQGINAATTGQTVCVAAGTYPEAVTINKSITLAGAGSATTFIGNGVRVQSPNVTVKGFTIGVTSGAFGVDPFSVYLDYGSGNVTIAYNDLVGGSIANARGVMNAMNDGNNSTINNNKASGFATGVYLNNSSNMTVSHNTLTGNNVGLSADHPNNSSVTFNIIKLNTFEGVGTLVAAADSVHVNNNNIYSNNAGLLSNLDNYDNTGTVDAINNWWGGATAVGINAQGGSGGTVNTAPVTAVAYPEF